jgi:hypothetical protein
MGRAAPRPRPAWSLVRDFQPPRAGAASAAAYERLYPGNRRRLPTTRVDPTTPCRQPVPLRCAR